jgi:pyridoxal phosphate enzyme, YggS family
MINVAALEEIYLNIDKAKAAQKRNDQPKIIAVTKTHPFSAIEDVYNCGIFSIGENRVQEASNKFQSFNKMPNLTKRFIGHLQSNKVKKCMELFDTIDTVDSLKLIRKISKQASEKTGLFPVLLEVNTSGEQQKHGFLPSETDEMFRCFDEPHVNVEGLMTVGPLTQDRQKIRESFRLLKDLEATINNHLGHDQLKELSMGMSGDYEIAIEEGSTMIRVGTALFGNRNK